MAVSCLSMTMSDIMFASVKDAVRWSEEMATVPDVRSCLGDLLRSPSSGKMSRQDMIDVAMTITHITASCKPWKGAAMRAIYAGHDRENDFMLAKVISMMLLEQPEASDKGSIQMDALGLATVKAMRAMELYGDRYPLKRMAYDCGVSRENFTRSKGWRSLRLAANDQLLGWIGAATNEIGAELAVRGWMA